MDKKKTRIILISSIILCVFSVLIGTLIVVGSTDKTDVATEITKEFYILLFFLPVPIAGIVLSLWITRKDKEPVVAMTAEEIELMRKEIGSSDETEKKPANRIKFTLVGANTIIAGATFFILLIFGCLTFFCAPMYSHDADYVLKTGEKMGVEFPADIRVLTTSGEKYADLTVSQKSGVEFTDESAKAFADYVKTSEVWHSAGDKPEGQIALAFFSTFVHGSDGSSYYCLYNESKGSFDSWPDFLSEDKLIYIRFDSNAGNMMIWEITTNKYAEESADET